MQQLSVNRHGRRLQVELRKQQLLLQCHVAPCSSRCAKTARTAVTTRVATASVGCADEATMHRLLQTPLPQLMQEAAALRDKGHGRVVTFSPKVSTHLKLSVFHQLLEQHRSAARHCTAHRAKLTTKHTAITAAITHTETPCHTCSKHLFPETHAGGLHTATLAPHDWCWLSSHTSIPPALPCSPHSPVQPSHKVHTPLPSPAPHIQVFIPLTRLCRDSCGYCTFAQPPKPGRRCYMTLEEVLLVAQLGAAQGCTEALFTLGEHSSNASEQTRCRVQVA